ncbi:MAG: hypothetical protein R6T91_10220 [Bacteroidales bacterium]
MLESYHSTEMSKMNQAEKEFMGKFYKVINHANILAITEEIEQALYAIERNGSANLIFLDLAFFLNRELRRGHQALSEIS